MHARACRLQKSEDACACISLERRSMIFRKLRRNNSLFAVTSSRSKYSTVKIVTTTRRSDRGKGRKAKAILFRSGTGMCQQKHDAMDGQHRSECLMQARRRIISIRVSEGEQTAPPARSDFAIHSTHVALSEHSCTVSAPASMSRVRFSSTLFPRNQSDCQKATGNNG